MPRLTRPTRTQLVATAGAAVTTAGAVALGVLVAVPDAPAPVTTELDASAAGSVSGAAAAAEERTIGTSRSVERTPVLEPRTPTVERRLWTTAPLKLRVQPRERAGSAGTFPDDQRIGVTGKRSNGYAEVVFRGQARWVSASYLSAKKKPDTGVEAGVNTAPCGKSASGGLQPSAQRVMNAVCHAFPEIDTYGGYAPRGEHGGGLAVDVMVSGALGEQVKQFLYAHRSELGLSNIIWAQTIWSGERGGEGFRGMEDRGSATANHFDHVHVLVNG